MATSDQLQSQIDSLNSTKSVLNQRLQELRSINVYTIVSGDVDKCNLHIDRCSSYISSGIKTDALDLSDDINAYREDCYSGYQAEIADYIQKEIQRCNSELSSLNSQISSKTNELNAVKEQERQKAESSESNN